jgi:hypothetical protein
MEQHDGPIFKEIQELKAILAIVIGTADRVGVDRLSTEALEQAAKLFQKMSIERGDWVDEDDLPKFLGPCPWNAGAFIRKEFAFTSWVKKGHEYRYSKKDLLALGQELKTHNIDLKRYQEFLDDKAAFDKKAALQSTPAAPKGKSYSFPKGMKNITTSEIPKPDPEVVRQDLAQLKQAFKEGKFEAYIDIYNGTHAMLKHIYMFQKYLEPGLKRRCQKWCEDFNYANHALELITGKKEKFVVTDPAAIQL